MPNHDARDRPARAPLTDGAPPRPLLARWPNFRDAGTWARRHVRPGRFYRAPAMVDLAPDEEARLAALDPGVIVDFRSPEEIETRPVRLPGLLAGRRVHLPLPALVDERFTALLAGKGLCPDDVAAAMAESYRDLARLHWEVFGRFLQVVAGAGDRPVIFHCTAGKDRTGLASALILAALGAPMEAVERDYLATGGLWRPDRRMESAFPAPAREAIFGVSMDYLGAALNEFAQSGGAPALAERAMGRDTYRAWKRRHAAA